MPVGDGNIFEIDIYNCRRWTSLNDLAISLLQIQREFGIRVFDERTSEVDLIDTSKFESFFINKGEIKAGNWDNNYYSVDADFSLTLAFEFPFLKQRKWTGSLRLYCYRFGDEFNVIRFVTHLLPRHVDKDLIEKYPGLVMNLYLDLAHYFIGQLSPEYVWLAADDDKYQTSAVPWGINVINKQIKVIFWANYFGPGYLSADDIDIFLKAPIGILRPFDNGFWYQLHENFQALSDEEMLDIEDKAMNYFSKYFKLELVQWRFVTI